MCITKLGATLPQHIWDTIKGIGKGFQWIGAGPIGKGVRRSGRSITSKFIGGVGVPAVKGITATGKFLYNRPEIAIPAIGASIYGIHKLKNDVRKNMYHVDPKYNITHSGILGKVKYMNPEYEQKANTLSIFNI